MRKGFVFLLALLMIAVGGLAASAQTDALRDLYMEAANDVVVTDTHVTFVDDSGRGPITIEKNPERVAVLYGSHACLWIEAGGQVSLGVGGASAITLYEEQVGRNFLEDEGVVTVATTSSGRSWDIEVILVEQPDLIICSTAMSGYSTISAPAEAVGIPVIALTYSGITDYLRWFKVFSSLNDQPELWDEIAEKVLDQVVTTVSKAPTENNPRVLSILPQETVLDANTALSDTGALLKELNAINVADPNESASAVRIAITLEEIYAANPDFILVQCLGSVEEARAKLDAQVKGHPVWESLDAVKRGNVHFLPKELFHNRPNRLYGESYQMLAALIYPDLDW